MSVDIVIIGGGVVGSAVAYFLARTGRAGKVVVIEPDPSYEFSATPAANGGIRQLFSLSENILMARYGLDFFAEFHGVMEFVRSIGRMNPMLQGPIDQLLVEYGTTIENVLAALGPQIHSTVTLSRPIDLTKIGRAHV